MLDDWTVTFRKAAPVGRLICLPHAGGSAAYFAPWRDYVPDNIELVVVQYPGRGGNGSDTPIHDPDEMVARLVVVIRDLDPLPFMLFGHSLGGLLAFETVRALRQRHMDLPLHLYISATKAPMHLPSRFVVDAVSLPEPEFLDTVKSLGGLPEDMLENAELRELVTRVMRTDFDLAARYRYKPQAPLPVSMTVLCGEADGHVSRDTLLDWKAEVLTEPDIRMLAGDHFYLEKPRNISTIARDLALRFNPPARTQII